jgi:5'-nucleotidase
MKILMTNDDGYDAGGVLALESAFSQAGHDVYVCAPDSQRSANSHCISMHTGVQIRKVKEHHYMCSGTPADCILFFLGNHMMGIPDLVISGINLGFNCGTDIIYSGTVAAAREAALHGIPSLAISLEDPSYKGCNLDFSPAVKFLCDNFDALLPLCSGKSFLNINVPRNPRPGFKVGKVCFMDYKDNFVPGADASEAEDIHLDISEWGHPELMGDGCGDSDFELVHEGWVSVTPLMVLPDMDRGKAGVLEQLGRT